MDKSNQPINENTYRTGDVYPPKSHRGVIAALLIAVIFLSGVVSVLSFWNIRLFRQLQAADETAPAVHFTTGSDQPTQKDLSYTQVELPALGITGCLLTSFDSHYYGLPQGVYITDVVNRSGAAQQGVCPGDILLQVNGEAITDMDALQTQLNNSAGAEVTLTLSHSGNEYQVKLPIE